MTHQISLELGGKPLTIETGKVAGQADGAVVVRYGDTVIMATAVMADQPREGIDFVPLVVDFEERLYAVGRIPGSFFRREGRPSDQAVLAARMIDRPVRPLLPKTLRNDVQVIVTTLSADEEDRPDILGLIGASAALRVGGIPIKSTLAGVRVGRVDGEFVAMPTYAQVSEGGLDLVVAGAADMVNMIEAGAKEVDNEVILRAVEFGQQETRRLVKVIDELAEKVGVQPRPFAGREVREEVAAAVGERYQQDIEGIDLLTDKRERERAWQALKTRMVTELAREIPESAVECLTVADEIRRAHFRSLVVGQRRRPDGRPLDELRALSCEVAMLPRAHGAGLFTRGRTQVLTIATLGAVSDQQRLDIIGVGEYKRFMHQYNFPPFSTGEVAMLRGPRRREVGHGALAEKALLPLIPSEEEFPQTIRLVSEVLESNGSTSMASVCGSTLALMDAGVPIERPVAGLSIGLIHEGDDYLLLTDLEGREDAYGDMDFKVAGTEQGVTAMQVDMKVGGLPLKVIAQALEAARAGRLQILEVIKQALPAPRASLSPYAPKMTTIHIDPSRIGEVIGPGGRVIKAIQAETSAEIDIKEDGSVFVASPDEQMLRLAVQRITDIVKEIAVGERFTGKVTRIMGIGAFVELSPGKEGMIPADEIDHERPRRIEDVVNIGDTVEVVVKEIDERGRINLSRKALLPPPPGGGQEQPKPPRDRVYLRDRKPRGRR
jgi:polyribonucleotide nucleotidyltransferase